MMSLSGGQTSVRVTGEVFTATHELLQYPGTHRSFAGLGGIGFYKTTDGCRHCHHYCRECDGSGPLHCTACPQRFMLDGGLCMECLGSQYFETNSGICRSCDDSCRMCSGPGQYSCTGCSRPLRLDRLNNQCVQCCSERVGNDTTRDCCHCDPDSGECINSSVAVRRIAEWSALHTESAGPSLTAVLLATAAVAGLVLMAAGVLVHQKRSRRPQVRSKGLRYAAVDADETDAPETTRDSEHAFEYDELEHAPLMQHST